MADSKKSKKHDRQRKSPSNLRYINEKRHGKSHIRRMLKHLLRYPNDTRTAETMMLAKRAIGMK